MDVSALVADFIARFDLLDAKQKVIVGVSGGTDSLCLLDCLHRLGYPLVLAHLDHQLRSDSDTDADFCRRMAERYGIPVAVEAADVRGFADGGHSLEEAARLLRYRFLVRMAEDFNTNMIATGHTADDQVETILMHFLRGAGPSGLRGMLPATVLDDWVDVPEGDGVMLIRPLLELTREHTAAHCKQQGLTPIQDPSNADPAFFRNRLRHELLPDLETYNPGVRKAILRTGSVMSAIVQMQDNQIREAWPQVVSRAGVKAFMLRVEPLLALPLAMQRALLRKALMIINPSLRDIGFEQVSRGIALIAAGKTGNRQAVIGNLELLHMGGDALLWEPGSDVAFLQFPQLKSDEPQDLKVPGMMVLAEGWELSAAGGKLTPAGKKRILHNNSKYRVFLDANCVEGDLSVRAWAPGDRIQPLGMKGRTKIADVFVNEHIPQPVRSMWPLVVDGHQIVWVAGVRMAHGVRLTENSDQFIELAIIRPERAA